MEATVSFIILSGAAIIYAILRAFQDKGLKESYSNWKIFATFLAGFCGILISVLVNIAFTFPWWILIVSIPMYGMIYWTVFDCLIGYFKGGSILYLGSGKWDAYIKKVVQYTEKRKAILLLGYKAIWLILLIGAYFSLLNTYVL